MKISGALAAQAAVLPVLEAAAPSRPTAPARRLVSPFTQAGKWYKAALHVHTTTSDGDVNVATRLAQYRAADYQVVAVTDRWTASAAPAILRNGRLEWLDQ